MTIKTRMRHILLVAGLLALTACIRNIHPVGYTFDEKALAQIVPGETRKSELHHLLGSPSSVSNLGEETWYYIFSEYETKAFFKPKLVKQTVVALSFDEQTVKDVTRYTEADAKEVALNEDETKTEGHDMGVVNQLLGNVGRFNPKGADDGVPGRI